MKKTYKKLMSFITVGLIFDGTILTGCSSKDSAEDSNTIKWANWDITDDSVEHKLIEAFEAKNQGIKVELTSIPSSDYQDKVTTLLASGDSTDVITIKNTMQYSALAYSGALEDLTDHVVNDVDKTDAKDAYNMFNTEDNKVYAQPVKMDSWYLFYNKDIFDEKNIDYPKDITWDQYVDLAKNLTYTKDDGTKVYGTYQVPWSSLSQCIALAQTGADFFGQDYSYLTDYYERVLDIEDKGYALDYATNTLDDTSYQAAFENGTAAMVINGSWYFNLIATSIQNGETDVNWGIAQIPQNSDADGIYTPGAVSGVSINSNSKNKEAAEKLVDFLSSKEAAEIYSKAGIIPAISNEEVTKNLLEVQGMANDDLTVDTLNADKNLVSELPVGKDVADISSVLEEEHTLIMSKEVSVKDGVADIGKKIKK